MGKKAFRPKRIVWMDLEMTGLDPVYDRILEVAAIVTDWEFQELAVFEAVQQIEERILEERMIGTFWDENAAVRDALKLQNGAGQQRSAVEKQLLVFLDEHIGAEEKALLAGNSIHQDRRFIANEWQQVDSRLHYRMLDVSAWKVVFEGKYGKSFKKAESHRALEDIRGSIAELRYYLEKVKG